MTSILEKEIITPRICRIVLYVLLLAPFFEPAVVYYFNLSTIGTLYNIGKAISVVVALFLLVTEIRSDKMIAVVLAIAVVTFISTVINGGDIQNWTVQWAPPCAVVLLIAAVYRKHPIELLSAICFLCSLLVLVNLASMVLFPEGLYVDLNTKAGDNFFFGQRNMSYRIILPSIVSSCLIDRMNNCTTSFRTNFLFVIGFAEVLIGFSATSFLAITVFSILYYLHVVKRIRIRLNSICILGCLLLLSALLVVFHVQDYFSFIIEGMLGRSMSLSGRTDIWAVVFALMDNAHLPLGYGCISNNAILVNGVYFSHAHNELLNIWFTGGTVALVLFILLLILVFYRMRLIDNSMQYALLISALSTFMIIGLTERIVCESFFILLSIAYYQSSLNSIEKKDRAKYPARKRGLQ